MNNTLPPTSPGVAAAMQHLSVDGAFHIVEAPGLCERPGLQSVQRYLGAKHPVVLVSSCSKDCNA